VVIDEHLFTVIDEHTLTVIASESSNEAI